MKQAKHIVRKQIKEKLNLLTKEEHIKLSREIAGELLADPLFMQAKSIGITISNFPEVDTYEIIHRAWELGKTVSVPKCLPKTREMAFRKLTSFHQLETVYSGLHEPIEKVTEETAPKEIDLLIVPGLGFTTEGFRLGFGGGYYDRYLMKYAGKTLSLAFEMQLMTDLPIETHDLPVDRIITNRGVYIPT
ncbi:5-formyltetrahydrofolate cyclo-ligase [Niallia sp. NCCP-28]|uniref:5-formyltetrahydrofolate cyclo-ligase n=1 Tax=Niallia sp. NCCP-28 TaxID=2934712 RepID=UPI0020889B61|nr:5-formyltetrahydrofolate cyclo-ligase [Niallia sp. NCCP-28]GKU81259.1 5-formyltetrahydrofolate cyclo-ligase [Niallia sp. NCCP-28]